MKNSNIEWCDHTFNPWEGCKKVSPGCEHCYAEARNARYAGGKAPNWGKGAPRRRTSVSNWGQPLKWDLESSEAVAEGLLLDKEIRRSRVFCASLADWLDDEVQIEWLADLLELIARTPHLDWLLLTKRPENFRLRCSQASINLESRGLAYGWVMEWVLFDEAPKNVWIGTTVEDQKRADERIPSLLKIPARVRFLSCEPLLGPVDLVEACGGAAVSVRIDWVICGGESGKNARPMHPRWAVSLRDQCKAASVPFLFKQWGEYAPSPDGGLPDDLPDSAGYYFSEPHPPHKVWRFGKKIAGRTLGGVEYTEFPEVRT